MFIRLTDFSRQTPLDRATQTSHKQPPSSMAFPEVEQSNDAPSVLVENLSFDFGAGPILTNVNLSLPPGSRCLLVGANGAGKWSPLFGPC
jgi:ABC-type bacteriocin/lantibiotic exporter with double-glycine peptidase domain